MTQTRRLHCITNELSLLAFTKVGIVLKTNDKILSYLLW